MLSRCPARVESRLPFGNGSTLTGTVSYDSINVHGGEIQEMSTVVTDGEDVGAVRFPSHVPLDEAGRGASARCLSCDENQSRAVNMAPTRAPRYKKVPVHTRAAAKISLRLPLGAVVSRR